MVPGSENIFLVGLMGVGKSTIGKRLAKKLQKTFVDSDKEVEKRTGASIELIFDIEGEEGFRKRESDILDELTARDGIILATGGGAVLLPENRERLSARGRVVYLKAPVEVLARRMSGDRKRPLLQDSDPLEKLQALQNEREPFYLEIADVIIVTDDLPLKHVVNKVLESLEQNANHNG
ncbi:MAG: shikimate kinase AroK [Gammaproteobacteria bacterium]